MWFTVYVMELEAIQPSCWCLMISYLLKKEQGHWVCPWNHTSHLYWTTDHCFCFDKPKQTAHIISHLDLWRSKKSGYPPNHPSHWTVFEYWTNHGFGVPSSVPCEVALAAPSYYEVLGVAKDADDRQIKKASGTHQSWCDICYSVGFAKKHGIQLHMWRVDILKYMW
jgi:hypothetical protein